jgi:hypothetical protein
VPNAEPISGTVIRLHEVTCLDPSDRVLVDRLSLAVKQPSSI